MFRCLSALSVTLLLLSFSGCGYDSFGDLKPDTPNVESLVNAEIGSLISYYNNAGERRMVYDDVVVGGYVTANDRSSNFFRTFTIQDHSGAIEVRAGGYSLHNLFVNGRYVVIKAKGLSVGDYNKVLQIGVEPATTGDKRRSPEYIGQTTAALDRFVLRSSLMEVQTPIVISRLSELTEDLCGRLITLRGVELVDDGSGDDVLWATPYGGVGTKPEVGYRIFADSSAEEFAVVTSGYANFAGETIPTGQLSISAILSRGKSDKGRTLYLLKMRDLDDVQPY